MGAEHKLGPLARRCGPLPLQADAEEAPGALLGCRLGPPHRGSVVMGKRAGDQFLGMSGKEWASRAQALIIGAKRGGRHHI